MSLNSLNVETTSNVFQQKPHYLTQFEKNEKWKQMLELHPNGLYPLDSPETKTFLGIYDDLTVPERNENNEVISLYFALQDYRMTNEILVKHIEKQFVYGKDSLYIREQYNPQSRDLVLYEIDLTLCPLNNINDLKKYLRQLYTSPKNTRLFPGVIVIDKNQILGQKNL